MSLLKNGEQLQDSWVSIADDAALPDHGAVIVSASRWESENAALKARATPLGVRLGVDASLDVIADDLPHIELVALAFPAFTDGRAYSIARILRDKYAYKGEIRAAGNVLRDQLAFMVRCGFDSFDVDDDITPAMLQDAIAEIDAQYQPASDVKIPAFRLRHS
jgi:uncharacterized protein (DUF934 family)